MSKTNDFKWLAVLLCALCLLFQGAAWSKTRPVAAVIAASGNLQVRRAGAANAAPLALRAPLFAGDVISTGPTGSAKVLFNDGSQVKMRANTRLRITAPDEPQAGTNLFMALAGEIWARLRPGRGVKTVYTNLLVRGTEFDLFVADDTATVTVIEGEVGFSNRFGAVTVGASQQSTARPDAAPTKPVTIANPGLIIEWTLDIENVAFPLDKSFGMTRDAAFVAADALFDSGKYEAALASYQQGGDAPAARLRSGYALLKLGRLDEAEAVFRGLTALPANAAQGWTGLAWTELKRNRFASAQTAAEQALATPEGAAMVEPHVALGVALLRQNKAAAAEAQLRAALEANPPEQRYQARAWLALLHLARSHNDEALKEARLAVQAAPNSSLAQVSLATVGFFSGETAEASRAAKRAAALSPDDMAVQVALGQAKLAEGDVDGAARAAARATALDPQWPQAHYLLGVADAGRRDWTHAARSLQKTLDIAPEFFPATAALARVYVKMNRALQGIALLDDYEKAHGESDITLAARGEVLYASARYKESLAAYRKAVALRPDSASNHAGLARVAIDYNHLAEAIEEAQKAVALAADVGAFHSILGLAYDYSRMPARAERSYRTALVLDPNNALALVKLGQQQRDGDPRTTERTEALSFAQGFIFDPDISRELLRGGVDTELDGRIGPDNHVGSLLHRETLANGDLHFLGNIFNRGDDGDRANTDLKSTTIAGDTTYQRHGTNFYAHLLHSRQSGGLAGTLALPSLDDREAFRNSEGLLALRHRINGRAHFWIGALSLQQKSERRNPDRDLSFAVPLPSGAISTVAVPLQTQRDRTFLPELRFDYALRQGNTRPSVLTFGLARPKTRTNLTTQLIGPSPDPSIPEGQGVYMLHQEAPVARFYAQWQNRITDRLSVIGQVRQEHEKRTLTGKGSFAQGDSGQSLDSPPVITTIKRTLPSLVANYRADARTNVRFLASRRVTDIASSIFAPIGTLLTTESEVLFSGLPDPSRNGDVRSFQWDVERYTGSGGLVKLFAFHSTGHDITYDFSKFTNPSDPELDLIFAPNSVHFDRVRRSGAGVRFEQQLKRGLFGQGFLSFNRTRATATIADPNTGELVSTGFGGQAPYHPKVVASLGLNYIGENGNKAGLAVNYNGSLFADTFDAVAATRPRLGSSTTVDLTLAHEPSVHFEVFLRVLNIFDKQRLIFNDIPLQGRRVVVGVVRRF